MHRADLIIGLIFLAFGGLVVSESLAMPRYAIIGANPVTAPGLVPGLLGGIIALFGAIMATRALLALRAGAHAPAGPVASEASGGDASVDPAAPAYVVESPHAGRNRFLTILVTGVAFAAVAVGRMPFWLATFLFVFVSVTLLEFQRYGGGRATWLRLAVALVIAGGTAWAITYIFESIFLVRLP